VVLRPSNCRWALHLLESYLHRWRHAVSEEVEIGSFGSTLESLFWQLISQNRSPVAGSTSPGQVVYHLSRTLLKIERRVNTCRVKLWPVACTPFHKRKAIEAVWEANLVSIVFPLVPDLTIKSSHEFREKYFFRLGKIP